MNESTERSGQTSATQDEPVIHVDETGADAVVSVEGAPVQGTLEGILPLKSHALEAGRLVRASLHLSLTESGRAALSSWISRCLRGGGVETARVAARIATTLRLYECGAALLERASRRSREDRDVFLSALAALGLGPAALAELLPSVDTAYRPEAIRVLWMLKGRDVQSHLEACLRDDAGPVRAAALEILAASGDPLALGFAESASTQDPSSEVRSVAARALRDADADQMLTALDHALGDPNPELRRTALEVLPDRAAEDPSPLVLRAIGDEDDSVQGAAMRWITALPAERDPTVWEAIERAEGSSRERLVSMLLPKQAERVQRLCLVHMRDREPLRRVMAVELAGVSKARVCLEAAAQALQDPIPEVRRAATRTLALVPHLDWLAPVKKALADPDVETRIGAVNALQQIHDDGAVDALVEMLRDPDAEVRLVAKSAVESLRSDDLALRLIAALGRPELRDLASQILVHWGEFVIDRLVDALVDADADVAKAAGRVLRLLASAERFRESMASLEPKERLRAVEALAAVRGPDAAELLTHALWDPDVTIRIRALHRLGQMRATEQRPAVARCLQGEPVPEVAAVALETLTRLGGRVEGA